jgi:predicted RNA-binding protein with PIN domain
MRFLIDGYNLLHAVWPGEGRHLRARAWPRFRERLLDHLRVRHAAGGGPVTVVFDAARAPVDRPAEEDFGGVHVRFAVGYPSADDLIEELIRTDSGPDGLTVVSDDRRLREAARRRGCAIAGCLDFFERVARPPAAEKTRKEPPAKPEGLSPDEVAHWLKEFGGDG